MDISDSEHDLTDVSISDSRDKLARAKQEEADWTRCLSHVVWSDALAKSSRIKPDHVEL